MSESLSPTQERALAHMRANHGKLTSSEGFSITTMRALERDGLLTMKTWLGADRTLSKNATLCFAAELTDEGWGDHERAVATEYPYGNPTPADQLHHGDVVINVHTGSHGIWHGRNAHGSYHVDAGGTMRATPDGHWRFESRPDPHPVSASKEKTVDPEMDDASMADAQGRLFVTGQRIGVRTQDGFFRSGPIIGFSVTDDGSPLVQVSIDTLQVAPSRSVMRGMPERPGRQRPVSPPDVTTLPLDKNVTPI